MPAQKIRSHLDIPVWSNPLSLIQGSIQQLVINDDPRAAEEQCEDDDSYVRNTHTDMVEVAGTQEITIELFWTYIKLSSNIRHINQHCHLVVK